MATNRKPCLHYLRLRELGFCKSIPRNDYKLFTGLVLSDGRTFTKRQEFSSSSAIFFEADKLYLDHYRRAYSVIKRNVIYDLRQSLCQDNPGEKITDSDIFYLTSSSEPADIICSELFIGLTDRHRILCLNATSGKLLNKVFLLPPKEQGYKFTEIGLGKDNETFYVKGRSIDLRLPESRRPHFVFATFNLTPLRFQYMFILRESVFGSFINVTISQDLIIFVHSGCLMKFYSLENLLRDGTLDGETATNGILHPNLNITSSVPCLFQIRVCSESLEMGGFPWHCLYKPPKQLNYCLESIDSRTLVKLDKNQLRQTDIAQGMEVNVFFNPDESGSIIFVSEYEIEKLVITDGECDASKSEHRILKQVWSFPIKAMLSEDENIIYTASGRKASRSSWAYNDNLEYIHCVQYLSSLNAFCVVVYYEEPEVDTVRESRRCDAYSEKARILIVDNTYGRLMKEIRLEERWDNACEEHHIELDDDILIHTIKHRSGKHSCHVYTLTEITEDALPSQTDHKGKKRKNVAGSSRKHQRTNATGLLR